MLTAFGVAALTFMLVAYALERRDRRMVIAFAAGCALSSAYGFLSGAWPFGVVEAVWTAVALQRSRSRPPARASELVAERNKALVRRLVDEVVNHDKPDVLDAVATGEVARAARAWIGPFRRSFPDFSMEIVELIAEGESVVGHFKCSGTQSGEWMGHAPTGRRFLGVDEIHIFRVTDGKLSGAVGVEDNLERLRQLGLPASVQVSARRSGRG